MASPMILLIARSLNPDMTLISQEVFPADVHCNTSRSRGDSTLLCALPFEGRRTAYALLAAYNAISSSGEHRVLVQSRIVARQPYAGWHVRWAPDRNDQTFTYAERSKRLHKSPVAP